jgi:hypothetical protein
MIMPAVISTVLALAPPTDIAPPYFIDGGGDVQVVAYDADGCPCDP